MGSFNRRIQRQRIRQCSPCSTASRIGSPIIKMNAAPLEIIGAILFGMALVHTFSTKFFERLAHTHPAHAGIWHFLGEVEVVFGLWAMVLIIAMLVIDGNRPPLSISIGRVFPNQCSCSRSWSSPGSRPILQFALLCVKFLARLISWPDGKSFYFVTLSFVPLLGSSSPSRQP